MRLVQHRGCLLKSARSIVPGEPLWKIAPTHDENGIYLCDFMVLIPKLKSRSGAYIQHAQSHIAGVLAQHSEVVFANLDMQLNILWISHHFRVGLMVEIISAIRQQVPEAVLVAHNARG